MIGFELIKSSMIKNFYDKKLHHGILIAGKKGIGKASFASEFCKEILGSEANFYSDTRIINVLEGKKEIGIEQIRDNKDFLQQSSGSTSFRFLIIDSACELTRQAANATLKSLEEPNKNCFLILITHNLSQILPTIRSRCLIIKPNDLNENQFFDILLTKNCSFKKEDLNFLAEICDSSPGIAIQYGQQLIELYQMILKILIDQKINEEFIKKTADKLITFSLFERIQMVFFNRLLKFLMSQNSNYQTYLENEQEAFKIIAKIHSVAWVLNLAEESMKATSEAIQLNCDKRTNIIANLSQLIQKV